MEPPKAAKKSKVADKTIPASVSSISPEATQYADLLEVERKLDWILQRKRMEIQDSIGRPMKTRRTLRVFLSHSVTNQPWQTQAATGTPDFETGQGIPSWSLRVDGRILDPHNPRKFSSFLNALIIEIDREPDLYPESNIVEWSKGPTTQHTHGFSVTRRHSAAAVYSPLNTRIILHLDHYPPRWKLAPELAALFDVQEETQVGIMSAFWNYIKINGLQDKNDRRLIRVDAKLKPILGRDYFFFHEMAATITPYIVKPDPIVLFHPIDLSPPDASEPTNLTESQLHHKTMKIYDIEIDVEDTSKRTRIGALLTSFSPTTTTALSQVDDQLAQTAQALRNALLKKEFFDTFAEDPVGFIQTWIESQKEDLDMILGTEGGVREDELRRSEFFRMPWVEEAVAIHEGVRVVAALQVAQQQEMQVASSGGR